MTSARQAPNEQEPEGRRASRIRIEVTWTSSPGATPTSLASDVPA